MHPLAEYPRPAMRRDSCEILNGPWQYAITQTAEYPAAWQGSILVPYSPEAPASGVGRTLLVDNLLTAGGKNFVDVLTLKAICDAVDIPVVAIGGIHKENILQLKGTGVDGVALVSAIFAADDIETECRELKALSEQICPRDGYRGSMRRRGSYNYPSQHASRRDRHRRTQTQPPGAARARCHPAD